MEKRNNNKSVDYAAPEADWWQGRKDGDLPDQLRWWQLVKLSPFSQFPADFAASPVWLGFACDEGVARNKGRIGAAEGPQRLRKACSGLPVHQSECSLYDAGNISCSHHDLEGAQERLANRVVSILKKNGFPLLLGGGHEILYGHYCGVARHFTNKKVGVINFDAHFDLRKPEAQGPSSGTGFYQIAEYCEKENKTFLYLALGIQKSGNTKELFQRAETLGTNYILAEDFQTLATEELKKQVRQFLDKTDIVCLTFDLDILSASVAPGVSAPSAGGLFYDRNMKEIWKLLARSNKIVSLDIAEYNPKYDIDNHTSKLAAQLLFDWVNNVERPDKE